MQRLLINLTLMFFFVVSVTLPSLTLAQSKVTTPKPGSAERKAIMDALRVPVSKMVKKKVIFRVGVLKTLNGWAHINGNALDEKSRALSDEFLWGEFTALLRKSGGKWKVLYWGFATDTGILEEIRKRYPQAPQGIF